MTNPQINYINKRQPSFAGDLITAIVKQVTVTIVKYGPVLHVCYATLGFINYFW